MTDLFNGRIGKIKNAIKLALISLYFILCEPSTSMRFVDRRDKALGTIIAIIVLVIVLFFVVVFASIYFVLTTPPGQTGLAGIGLQIANAIADPFISFFNGISKIISYYFDPSHW